MSKIHYIIYCHYEGKRYHYYACSDKTKSLAGLKLSEAKIFNTHKSAQDVVGRLPAKWRPESCKVTDKKLFHAKLKGI